MEAVGMHADEGIFAIACSLFCGYRYRCDMQWRSDHGFCNPNEALRNAGLAQ